MSEQYSPQLNICNNSFSLTFPIFPDFSLTTFQFPDFSRFSRRVATLNVLTTRHSGLVALRLGRWTCDQVVVGLIPGRATINLPRSTQPSIPPGQVNRVLACLAGLRWGVFACVGWQITLCDPIRQVMHRSSEMGFP